MGTLYVATLPSTPTAITAQVDFFEFNAGSASGLLLHAVFIGQTTELGDAMEEQWIWSVKRGATTSGSGGNASAAPVAMHALGAAANSAFESMNTTKATSGTIVSLHRDVFNVRAGLQMIWTPEMRPHVGPSGRMTIELESTPGDTTSVTGCAIIEEVG